jgi:hypothetical protein
MVQFHATQSTIARASWAVVISALLILGSAAQAFAWSEHHTCNSVEVATFTNRVHVKCDRAPASGHGEPSPLDNIVFFAVATTDSAHAARILSVLMMAHLAQREIVIEYDSHDNDGTSFGCLQQDCFAMISVAVR